LYSVRQKETLIAHEATMNIKAMIQLHFLANVCHAFSGGITW
jgi:hypothetical protein